MTSPLSRCSLLLLALTTVSIGILAPDGRPARGAGHHQDCCPQCGAVCQPIREDGKEKKHCWKVECEHICIPPVRFPWVGCEVPLHCGRVKAVRRLKKEEYECPTCKIKWEVQGGCSCPEDGKPAAETAHR